MGWARVDNVGWMINGHVAAVCDRHGRALGKVRTHDPCDRIRLVASKGAETVARMVRLTYRRAFLYRQYFCCTAHARVPKLTHMSDRATTAAQEDHNTEGGYVAGAHHGCVPLCRRRDSCRSGLKLCVL